MDAIKKCCCYTNYIAGWKSKCLLFSGTLSSTTSSSSSPWRRTSSVASKDWPTSWSRCTTSCRETASSEHIETSDDSYQRIFIPQASDQNCYLRHSASESGWFLPLHIMSSCHSHVNSCLAMELNNQT